MRDKQFGNADSTRTEQGETTPIPNCNKCGWPNLRPGEVMGTYVHDGNCPACGAKLPTMDASLLDKIIPAEFDQTVTLSTPTQQGKCENPKDLAAAVTERASQDSTEQKPTTERQAWDRTEPTATANERPSTAPPRSAAAPPATARQPSAAPANSSTSSESGSEPGASASIAAITSSDSPLTGERIERVRETYDRHLAEQGKCPHGCLNGVITDTDLGAERDEARAEVRAAEIAADSYYARAKAAESQLSSLQSELDDLDARWKAKFIACADDRDELACQVRELRADHDRVLGALRKVEAAHRAVIEGVTPKHPNWCADDHEAYEARFSAWHGACYALSEVLSPKEQNDGE